MPQIIPTGTALARHQAFLDDLDALGAESGNMSMAELRNRMFKTRQVLQEHFDYEEQQGYLNAVGSRDPKLAGVIQSLQQEHQQLRQALDRLLWRFEHPHTVAPTLRAEFQKWVADVRRHETQEHELIEDAFARDYGSAD